MDKKCLVCGEDAKYQIAGTNNYYCLECATELFHELSYLKRVDSEAKLLKKAIDNKINNIDDEENKTEKKDN